MSWTARASLRAGRELTGEALIFLGFDDVGEDVQTQTPSGGAPMQEEPPEPVLTERELRSRGAELLRESADVDAEDGVHPAHARILEELAPDEARILRLLAVDGPQPLVDVRSANLIGAPSELIARNLTMIGPAAGCRYRERVSTYLDNLERLGLIRVSDTPLEDLVSYQVLEAQPEVLEAIKDGTRAKPIQRSVRLTSLGDDFCRVCLPLDQAETESEPGAANRGSGSSDPERG